MKAFVRVLIGKPGFWTDTSTAPTACGGTLIDSCWAGATAGTAAASGSGLPSTVTTVFSLNPVPVNVTGSPPRIEPVVGLRLVSVVGPLTVNGAWPTGREYPGSRARTPVATGSPGGTTAWNSVADTKVCDVAGTPLKETSIRSVK